MAIALIVPAAVVAGIFTAAGLATGTPARPAAQPTDGPQLPSEIQPPRDTATGPGGGTRTTPGATGTTRSPTGTRTSPGVPGVPAPRDTGATAATCVTPGTGGPAVPGSPTRATSPTTKRTSPTATRTSPTRTATTGAPTGTAPTTGGTVVVPGAQEATGTPTATRTSPTRTGTAPAPGGTAAETTLMLGTAGGKSDVIVDQNGCAVYLNTKDTATSTACDAACEQTWHPVLAPAKVRDGLDQEKLGTFQRPSGKTQVTYNGHPLYRFAGDRAPGEAKGQGVNDQWFLVNRNGDPAR